MYLMYTYLYNTSWCTCTCTSRAFGPYDLQFDFESSRLLCLFMINFVFVFFVSRYPCCFGHKKEIEKEELWHCLFKYCISDVLNFRFCQNEYVMMIINVNVNQSSFQRLTFSFKRDGIHYLQFKTFLLDIRFSFDPFPFWRNLVIAYFRHVWVISCSCKYQWIKYK